MAGMDSLNSCTACGLIQKVPAGPDDSEAFCANCQSVLFLPRHARTVLDKTFHLSLAALILLIPGVFLPIMKLEKFGYAHETGVLDGAFTLLGDGHLFLGILILACSVVLPLLKLGGLLFLTARPDFLGTRNRATLLHLLKMAGRWGMLDVLLLAILTAAVKLGDIVQISPGRGALIFSLAVFLSLGASLVFEPQALWEPSLNRNRQP